MLQPSILRLARSLVPQRDEEISRRIIAINVIEAMMRY